MAEKNLDNQSGQTNTTATTTQNDNQTNDNTSGSGNDNNQTAGSSTGTDKSFTQDEVSRMMSTEKRQGRNSVYRQLGLDPNTASEDDIKNALAGFAEYQNSKKSDAEKAAAKAIEDQQKLNAANAALFQANAKVKAMELGVQPQFVDDMVVLATTKLGADEKNDLDALATAVGELKAKYPVWFGSTTDDDNNSGKGANDKNKAGLHGTGSSMSSTQSKNGTKDTSMGARLAAQRKHTNKSNFWK